MMWCGWGVELLVVVMTLAQCLVTAEDCTAKCEKMSAAENAQMSSYCGNQGDVDGIIACEIGYEVGANIACDVICSGGGVLDRDMLSGMQDVARGAACQQDGAAKAVCLASFDIGVQKHIEAQGLSSSSSAPSDGAAQHVPPTPENPAAPEPPIQAEPTASGTTDAAEIASDQAAAEAAWKAQEEEEERRREEAERLEAQKQEEEAAALRKKKAEEKKARLMAAEAEASAEAEAMENERIARDMGEL